MEKIGEKARKTILSWLRIQPSSAYAIQIQEYEDFELNAIRNRIWYRGDGNELQQLYAQTPEPADRHKFWAVKSTPGQEIRKIHTGLPGLMVRVLSSAVMADMNDIEVEDSSKEAIWKDIERENKFRKMLERVIKELLYIGDGAYKVTIDTGVSQYPIMEWYPGDRVEIEHCRGRVREVVFKTPYTYKGQMYVLHEHYGFGYIKNELYRGETLVDFKAFPYTRLLSDLTFDKAVILAVPVKIFASAKWEGRGQSIFDGKRDSFDAFDEVWSQWMDAVRTGRAKTYIPECLIPRDPETGALMRPNAFDNRFIATENAMGEKDQNRIDTEQPSIPHESYMASYCTSLDMCLQGVISPSTLGIDVKKLDNAEAQREKEKATLYTRNAIVEALQESIPEVVNAALNAYAIFLAGQPVREVKVDVPFGEYANPSFESQVETVSKAKSGGIMSIEAAVEELYGDSKDKKWKDAEVERLKKEQGIEIMEEPGVNIEGVEIIEGQSGKPGVPDVGKRIPGASPNSI